MNPKDIDPERYYSCRQVAAMKILPWRSATTIMESLSKSEWKEIFKPVFDRKKNGTRAHVKGEYLLAFIEKAKGGDFSK